MLNKILEIVNLTIEKSEFYQIKYKQKKFDNFLDVPFLTKRELIEDQLSFPPFGRNFNLDLKDVIRIHRTSGTTQKPLLLLITEQDEKVIRKTGAKALRLAGVSPDEIVINCMNYSMWMGGFMDHLSIEESGAVVIPYGVGNTESLVELLLSIENVSIHATPSYMQIIKNVLEKNFGKKPRDLKLLRGYFGGESGLQNPEFRNKLEEEWGFEAFNANYGLSEAMSIIGGECKYKDGLHFVAYESLYPEIINDDNEVIELKTGARGELVVTNLCKQSQPLIRYRTGDLIEIISSDECKCGEKGFKFKVIGRKDDMIVVKGINFFPESIRKYISDKPSLTGTYKVLIPETPPINDFEILVEYKTYNREDIEKLEKEIKNNLFVKPRITPVEKIEVGSGNKIRIVERVK